MEAEDKIMPPIGQQNPIQAIAQQVAGSLPPGTPPPQRQAAVQNAIMQFKQQQQGGGCPQCQAAQGGSPFGINRIG